MHRPLTSVATRDADGAILQSFAYGYDSIGNMLSRADSTTGLSETFTYDELDRLVTVTGPASKTYEYDSIGNILNKTDVAPYVAGGSYVYGAGKPHAVSAVQGVFSFGYDGDGNVSSGAGRTLSLTAFNLPASLQMGAAFYSWAYDATYARAKFVTPTDTKIYVRAEDGLPMYERTISQGSGVQTWRSMIYAGNTLIAQDTQRSNGQNDFRYFYYDGLRSLSLVADTTGQVVERMSYDAFGKRRFPNGADDPNGTLSGGNTPYSFTGHEYLDGLGLIHMNARLYDPFIGRFISADGRDGKIETPQDLNRYSYVLNNPMMYFDATGFDHVAFPSIHWQNGGVGEIPSDATRDDNGRNWVFLWFCSEAGAGTNFSRGACIGEARPEYQDPFWISNIARDAGDEGLNINRGPRPTPWPNPLCPSGDGLLPPGWSDWLNSDSLNSSFNGHAAGNTGASAPSLPSGNLAATNPALRGTGPIIHEGVLPEERIWMVTFSNPIARVGAASFLAGTLIYHGADHYGFNLGSWWADVCGK